MKRKVVTKFFTRSLSLSKQVIKHVTMIAPMPKVKGESHEL